MQGVAELPLLPECLPYLAGRTVVVGLSGGRDSVALLLALHRHGCSLRACHVHHGIRGAAADEDAAFCQNLCTRLEIPFEEHRVCVPQLAAQSGESLETAARRARHEILAACAARCAGHTVALAHHADDQAETVLFRLARGSAGLRGMLPVRRDETTTWLRPLLGASRAQITTWLQAQGQDWREDATNAVPDAARNRIRLEVLPALARALGRDVVPVLNRSARLQQETLAALDAALSMMPLTDPQGRLFLPGVEKLPGPLRKAAVARFLRAACVPDLTEEHVLAVLAILPADAPAARVNLPGGFSACRREKRLVVRNAAADPVPVPW